MAMQTMQKLDPRPGLPSSPHMTPHIRFSIVVTGYEFEGARNKNRVVRCFLLGKFPYISSHATLFTTQIVSLHVIIQSSSSLFFRQRRNTKQRLSTVFRFTLPMLMVLGAGQ